MAVKMKKIETRCVFCCKKEAVEVPYNGYMSWRSGELIQRAMPEVHSMVRDVLVTNMCMNCLSKTYNRPKPDDDWGEMLKNCDCCDTPLWKRNVSIDVLTCPNCFTQYNAETLEEIEPEGFEDEEYIPT